MNNLHITLTPFKNESRILKETRFLVRNHMVDQVFIVALNDGSLLEHEAIDENRSVWRVTLQTRRWSKSLLIQLLKYIEFCCRVILFARTRKINFVNVHCLALLPLGVFLKYYLHSQLVYDTHELETETQGNKGLRRLFSKFVESTLIRFADLTIVVGDKIERYYRNRYPIKSICAALNCPPYSIAPKSRLLRDEFSIPDNKSILIYVGTLARGRGIDFLIDCIEHSPDEKHVLVFMGYGELESAVKEASMRCQRILFKPAVSPDRVISYIASADIGVLVIDDSCLSYRYCLPNKLFECIIANIPIVISNLPEMRNIVLSYHIGAVLERRDAAAFFEATSAIERMDQSELKRNLQATAKIYCWENQETVLIKAYATHLGIVGQEGARQNG